MALRCRRIEIFLELWWLVASGVMGIWVSSTSFKNSDIGWPQQPPTKKVVNFNVIFHKSTKSIFFQNIKIKLKSRSWMTLKSSLMIFQALEPFLLEAVEASQYYFFENLLIKTKCHNLLNRPPKIWNGKSQSVHLSEPIYFVHFNVRYPVIFGLQIS